MQADFERELSKKIRVRRLTACIVCLLFFTLFIASWIMLEATKETIVHGGPAPIPAWTSQHYNGAYIIPIVLGLIGAMMSGIFLIMDFAMCGHRTVHKDLHCITLYRGMCSNIVYVDGQEKGRIAPFSHTNVVEVWLPNRIRATVSFSRSMMYMAHVSFSDDTASREV